MDLGDDSDVKLLKVSGGLFDTYFDQLPKVLYADDDEDENGEKTLLLHNDRRAVERLVQLVSRSVLLVTGELLPPPTTTLPHHLHSRRVSQELATTAPMCCRITVLTILARTLPRISATSRSPPSALHYPARQCLREVDQDNGEATANRDPRRPL